MLLVSRCIQDVMDMKDASFVSCTIFNKLCDMLLCKFNSICIGA